MGTPVAVGSQSFEYMRREGSFYVDKTPFIKEWWENKDIVTLITRPRRFGKTLNQNMMECFFSNRYQGRGELFQGLSIWEEEGYRALQGQFPVIFLSFADMKGSTFGAAREGLIAVLKELYRTHSYLLQGGILREEEKKYFYSFGQAVEEGKRPCEEITDTTIAWAIKTLMSYMERYYGKQVLVFLDEYDTPLQEAYVNGYWEDLAILVRSLFNSTFKTNRYLYRALMTGITRVSKESIFSDLNNLLVVTTTSAEYSTAFGFTQEEVFQAMEEWGLSAQKEEVRSWYDGFCFGNRADMYNPWSITMFLKTGEFGTYWADTSSNKLVSKLLKEGTPEIKMHLEQLLAGKSMEVILDEQVIFEQLKVIKGAIWSLLVASGYLKPVNKNFQPDKGRYSYQLRITNHETELMFRNMIAGWFPENVTAYSDFKKALLLGDLDYMNRFMNEVSQEMFGSFDTGNRPSCAQPERFYHGFVLGLVVDLAGRYRIRSNRESGFGRYDVIMEPKYTEDDGIIMEFKVFDSKRDGSLEGAVGNALDQIRQKRYETELVSRGISRERIRIYGFVFEGKRVLIGQGEWE